MISHSSIYKLSKLTRDFIYSLFGGTVVIHTKAPKMRTYFIDYQNRNIIIPNGERIIYIKKDNRKEPEYYNLREVPI
jgi:hypothetical protein